MKKLLVSMLLLSCISLTTIATAQVNNPKKGSRRSGGFMKELNLTADQQEKIKSLNEDYKKKFEDIRAQQKQLAIAKEADMEKILTPEQQAKLKTMKEARKQKGGKKGPKMIFDDVTKQKLVDLKANFDKEVKAVNMSRIAPAMQETKKQELRTKYKADRKAIIDEFSKGKK